MSRIEVKNITKNFKDTKALDNVCLCFEENKIYGLLGRNGAGKTTLLNVINDRIHPDSGTVISDGQSVSENDRQLRRFYYISENLLYPESMKVRDIFKWTKEFYPDFDMDYAFQLCKLFEMPLKKKSSALSTGYKSILKNIIALSVNTPYVFLDEPVLGLDAYHRELFYKLLIEKYSSNPFTIVISTHLIEEIAHVIEEVIIIKDGRIIKNQPIEELLSGGYTVSGPVSLVDAYVKDKKIIGSDNLGGLKTVYVMGNPGESIPDNLEISSMDLQKLFIQLTNI